MYLPLRSNLHIFNTNSLIAQLAKHINHIPSRAWSKFLLDSHFFLDLLSMLYCSSSSSSSWEVGLAPARIAPNHKEERSSVRIKRHILCQAKERTQKKNARSKSVPGCSAKARTALRAFSGEVCVWICSAIWLILWTHGNNRLRHHWWESDSRCKVCQWSTGACRGVVTI